jgi:hypothetical protein
MNKIQTVWAALGLLGEIIRLINNAIEAQREAGTKPASVFDKKAGDTRLGDLAGWARVDRFIAKKAAK